MGGESETQLQAWVHRPAQSQSQVPAAAPGGTGGGPPASLAEVTPAPLFRKASRSGCFMLKNNVLLQSLNN